MSPSVLGPALVALVLASLPIAVALSEYGTLAVVKEFADSYIAPNNVIIAESINRCANAGCLGRRDRLALLTVEARCLQKMLPGRRMVSYTRPAPR
jgi:hypothetical protein